MLLKSILIRNFRQFMDEEIIFSTDPERNITVVHGENGTGKTTLLKALNWVFYGKNDIFSDGKENIINKTLAKDLLNHESIECLVEVKFIHSKKEHRVTRTQIFLKTNDKISAKNSYLKIDMKSKNGIWDVLRADVPQRYIDSIFPSTLSSYFLFNGERIRSLGDNTRVGKKDVRDAVATVLNLDTLSNSSKHLKEVSRMFEKEYSDDFQNSDNNNLIELKETLIDELDTLSELLENEELNHETYGEELRKLSDSLLSLEEIQEKEKQKIGLERDIKHHDTLKSNESNSFFRSFNSNLISIFGNQLFNISRKYLSEFELEDGIIEGISAKAIDQLIERKYCLCGEPITESGDIYKALTKLKEFLPPENYGVMVNGLLKEVDRYQAAQNYKSEMENSFTKYLEFDKNVGEMESKLYNIRQYMEDNEIDKIKNIEKKRIEFLEKQVNSHDRIVDLKNQIINISDQIDEIKESIQNADIKNKSDQLIRKKVEIVEKLIQYFNEFFEEQESEVRKHLQTLVGGIFSDIIVKDYHLTFDERYNFFVRDVDNSNIAMSEGEKQITSLSFISGIVNMAKDERLNKRFSDRTNYDSTEIYPVVMDSPFGTLDNTHRKNVAEVIPRLSSQTILFASSSQWKGEVEKAMRGIVGKEYTMHYSDKSIGDYIAECTKLVEVSDV